MPKKGIIMPKVGIARSRRGTKGRARTAKRQPVQSARPTPVLEALFSTTQQRVLALIFGQPDRLYGINELIALTGAGSGAVQREVKKLVSSGLVTRTELGREKRYRANRDAFLYAELRSIVDKTLGVTSKLRDAMTKSNAPIELAILYGSVAKASDTARSDVDVLLVSDELTLRDALAMFEETERQLGRPISPTVLSVDEYRRGRDAPFLSKLLAGDHVVLLGNESAVTAA